MLADALQACRPGTRIAIAADLTSPAQWIRMDRVEAWRARPVTIGKRPAIFLLLAEGKRPYETATRLLFSSG